MAVVALDDCLLYLKEEVLRKSVIRTMLAMGLLMTGSAMQALATTLPACSLLPPVSCK
jgi:hypothetical protein